MKVSITVKEDTAVFFYLRDMWERSNTKETLKDYLADAITEMCFNNDKEVDEALDYLRENLESIAEKHPEVLLLVDSED